MSHSLRERLPAKTAPKSHALRTNKGEAAERSSTKLLSLANIPGWAMDNEYIHHGYRQISNSFLKSFQSCFYVHNETGNIYSHFLAAVWMVALPIALYPFVKEHYPQFKAADKAIFGLFFLGGFLCYSLSMVYHVFTNHSQGVHNLFLRLDLFGITLVTAGCFPPGVWYTFPCADRHAKLFWISLDVVAQIVAATLVLCIPKFRKPNMKPLRGLLFSLMASSAFYPIVYACYLHGYQQMAIEAGATRYLWTVLTYVIAVITYATKIPEAWKPGYFDIWGQSHQIFHVLMAVGLTFHFSAFVKAFDHAYRFQKC